MNINFLRKIAHTSVPMLAILTGLLPITTGCQTRTPRVKPIALTLNIKPAGLAASLTVPVYVGTANQTYEKALMEDPVDQLLDRIRSTPPVDLISFQLTTGGTNISRLDPKWSYWLKRQRDHVVIIADLPKNYGGEARRRLNIPLDKRLWRHLPRKSKKTVNIEIHETGLRSIDNPRF